MEFFHFKFLTLLNINKKRKRKKIIEYPFEKNKSRDNESLLSKKFLIFMQYREKEKWKLRVNDKWTGKRWNIEIELFDNTTKFDNIEGRRYNLIPVYNLALNYSHFDALVCINTTI